MDLDLHFLPAWAQRPPEENKYAKYEGDESRARGRGDRPDRRERRHDRDSSFRREPRRTGTPEGKPGRPEDRGGRPGRFHREGREARIETPPAPPPQINLAIIPDEKGVESLARQIRLTGRAYPLFEIGFLVLKKPDRYNVRFTVNKNADGSVIQPLFVCGLDDTLCLSEQEAVAWVLEKHFATFYQEEKTPTDPPKGTYTFVAQCGMSGSILGPPNYHDYQNKLRKLHSERFARMPFEVFKSRIKIVRDEATVKKWLDEQSWKLEYVCLNVPETVRLGSREEVEKHFRETHLANVIKTTESVLLSGKAALSLRCRPLQNFVRRTLDEQSRFPLKVVTVLSQQFAGHGLQFFKVNKTVTHVAVARPHYLDVETTPISEGVKRIVDWIKAHPNSKRRQLLEALAPAPAPVVPSEPAPAGAPETPEPAPTPEATAVISDLHWLIHQGHVIEFASGVLEMARKPPPRPPKPAPAPPAEAAPAGSATSETSAETPESSAASSPSDAEAPKDSDSPQAAGSIAGEEPAQENAGAPPSEAALEPPAANDETGEPEKKSEVPPAV